MSSPKYHIVPDDIQKQVYEYWLIKKYTLDELKIEFGISVTAVKNAIHKNMKNKVGSF